MRPACKGVVARTGLLNWLAQADTDDGKGDGLTSDDRKELATLRKEKRRLEVENEILRPGRRPRRWPAGASCSAAPLAVEKLARDAHLLADLVRDAILSHGEAVRGPKSEPSSVALLEMAASNSRPTSVTSSNNGSFRGSIPQPASRSARIWMSSRSSAVKPADVQGP